MLNQRIHICFSMCNWSRHLIEFKITHCLSPNSACILDINENAGGVSTSRYTVSVPRNTADCSLHLLRWVQLRGFCLPLPPYPALCRSGRYLEVWSALEYITVRKTWANFFSHQTTITPYFDCENTVVWELLELVVADSLCPVNI